MCEQWQQCHQRYNGQVLEKQDSKGRSAVTRAEFTLVAEYLQAESSRGECQSETYNQGCTYRNLKGECHQGDDRARGKNLSGAEAEYASPHDPQARRLQLDTDNEQQEDNAKFGEVPYLLHSADETEAPRTNHGTCNQKTQNRTEPETLKQWHCNDGRCQQDYNIDYIICLGHASVQIQ